MDIDSDEDVIKEKPKHIIIKNSTDLQRMKLEKLMKNPEKPVVIPEKPKARGVPAVPDFVRNVMGSSAGAGSGEFHVYRHLRRKEYARQKYMQEKGERERLDEEYHKKLEENRLLAEAKTAKKRAKRLKKKGKNKQKGKKIKLQKNTSDSESESTSEAESTNEDENNGQSIIKETPKNELKEEIKDIQNESDLANEDIHVSSRRSDENKDDE
ncbi:PRKR-interacting protein 1 homolog [Harmonia axyridis]|uniref:PRKR-interacting protein 1 homolog n=1 Tax=Harmonia axyridis TaxID=115357 RepID=UPI001E2750FF|nr:PRKR-interacting protein 1 homolog [Harmonia axyridis]